jgi:hypothetical protein
MDVLRRSTPHETMLRRGMRSKVAVGLFLVQLSQSFRAPVNRWSSLVNPLHPLPSVSQYPRIQLSLRKELTTTPPEAAAHGTRMRRATGGEQGCAELAPPHVSVARAREDADTLFAEAVATYKTIIEDRVASAETLVEGMQALEEVFRLDFEAVRDSQYGTEDSRRSMINVTCMRPASSVAAAQGMRDDALRALALEPGRVCREGRCCDACSRVLLPHLASSKECLKMMQHAVAFLPGQGINVIHYKHCFIFICVSVYYMKITL